MKNTFLVLPLAVSALCLPACKPKESQPAPSTPAETTTAPPAEIPATPVTPPPAPPTPPAPSVTPEERTAKLGFARHLPADVQSLVSIHNGAAAVNRFKNSKFWQIASETTGIGNDLIPDQEIEIPEDGEPGDAEQDGDAPPAEEVPSASNPALLFGREITLAFGKGTAEQTVNLAKLNHRFNYQRVKLLIQTLAKSLESGGLSEFDPSEALEEAPFKALLTDPKAGNTLFSAMNMPPIYAAFLSSAETKEADLRTISSPFEMLGMLGEMVAEAETEVAGNKFTGSKIVGAKVAEMMAASRESAADLMDDATFNQYVESIRKKNLVILTGTVGDYVVVFIGGSEEELKFAASPAESLAGGDSLRFADPYLSKDLLTVIHGNKELISTLVKAGGSFGAISDGVRDGLAGTTSLGDTRDIIALLEIVTEKENELIRFLQADATGSVSYFEEGLKWESFGGIDSGMIDWSAANRLAALGQNKDVLLFANLSTPAAFEKTAAEYYEAIFETAYTIAAKVAEKSGDAPEIQPFKQGMAMFEEKFRADLVNMWSALSVDMDESLGRERAWIIDLKGTVPPVPGIPQNVVDQARFPRISLLAPVTDRAKLAKSWDTINQSLTRTLSGISEMTGNEIPMQKPISSEKNDLTTWFFSMPFFNDEFIPSVTLNDQWFAASTSKNQAVDLIGQAAAANTSSKGACIRLNFQALHTYLKDSLPIIKQNATTWSMSEDDVAKFSRIPDALGELDSMEATIRREGETIRTSFHFKTR